jgi:uncharacterized oligopeptide transporter (OPT) family protein
MIPMGARRSVWRKRRKTVRALTLLGMFLGFIGVLLFTVTNVQQGIPTYRLVPSSIK